MIHVKFVPAKSTESVLHSMKEGIRFIRRRDGMSALVILAFCTTLFGFSLNGFLPVFVRTIFKKGPETYTILLVCSGAGSIVGALSVAAVEKMKGQGRVTLMILVLLGLIVSAFASSRWLPLSCVLMFLAGAAIMASASFMLSLAQLITTDAMRGRVMSVYNLAFRAGIPLGALVVGKLIPIFGVSKVLTAAGFSLVAISLYFLTVKQEGTFRPASEKA
jgi:predicted MFS family arabinose efflux permease